MTGELERPLNPNSIYHNVVRKYGHATGLNIEVNGPCVHSMRATAATNALSHEADIAKVQEWLGHANVSTTRLYDRAQDKAGRLINVPGAVLKNYVWVGASDAMPAVSFSIRLRHCRTAASRITRRWPTW